MLHEDELHELLFELDEQLLDELHGEDEVVLLQQEEEEELEHDSLQELDDDEEEELTQRYSGIKGPLQSKSALCGSTGLS